MVHPVDLQELSRRLEQGAVEPVVAELRTAVKAFPGHVAAHALLALALESLDEHEEALQVWRRAYRLCPDSPVIMAGLRESALRKADRQVAEDMAASDHASPDIDDLYGDLDSLIEELETARIVPDPAVPAATEADLTVDVDDVASETLARIYANQKFYSEAARVYEKLASQQPERADEFRKKASEIRGQVGG